MAYLVDEKKAERSRNHPTKVKRAKRQDEMQKRRDERRALKKFKKESYPRSKSGPVRIYKPNGELKVGFYDSQEWRELRYKVLQKYGAKCQCCGATRNDNVRIHVDHIKPRSRFPKLELDIANLQILCEACNMGKRAHDMTDWR